MENNCLFLTDEEVIELSRAIDNYYPEEYSSLGSNVPLITAFIKLQDIIKQIKVKDEQS